MRSKSTFFLQNHFFNTLKNRFLITFFIISCISVLYTNAQIKLPKLISDGMVLQRQTEVKIWGWAAENEKISIKFIDSTYETQANAVGEWSFKLKKLEAGGPYKMVLIASNTIEINDILIGDVWLCSGQSNMELPMRRVSWVFPKEIEGSENDQIRHFYVPRKFEFQQANNDLASGSWKKANPVNVLDFSATAYFFAKEIYQQYKIPIGLINSAFGGSPVEAWISESAIKKFPDYYQEYLKHKDQNLISKTQQDDNIRISNWHGKLHQLDKGFNESPKWFATSYDDSQWKTMQIPAYWSDVDTQMQNGAVWFRKKIQLPNSVEGKPALLVLGAIVDSDSAFVNGEFVGSTGYQYPPRRYQIPANLLKEGENLIVVRVISDANKGGFVPDKNYRIEIGDQLFDLKGEWKYALGANLEPTSGRTFFNTKPVGLYNAMINPVLPYSIKGVIWYQGETNADRPKDYYELFTTLIMDWREKWNQKELPFLFVQLPNFKHPKLNESESNWAILREAQMKALSVPKTGMAIAIDLGEWNDIHPLNKKDIGYRLAKVAKHMAYNENNTEYSGPVYKNYKIEGCKIIIEFDHVGAGLISKDKTELKNFTIAGEDHKFLPANAKIVGNIVEVWNDAVVKPLAVRYAWADNPGAVNFYNSENLPAAPFRTDNWNLFNEKTNK